MIDSVAEQMSERESHAVDSSCTAYIQEMVKELIKMEKENEVPPTLRS